MSEACLVMSDACLVMTEACLVVFLFFPSSLLSLSSSSSSPASPSKVLRILGISGVPRFHYWVRHAKCTWSSCICLCQFFLVMSCLFITLKKCLKGHKSLGLLLGGVLKMSLSLSIFRSARTSWNLRPSVRPPAPKIWINCTAL